MSKIVGGDIIMSANNNEEYVVFPIVPPIGVDTPQKNEEFESADKGTLNMIGKVGLRRFSITSIFPGHPTHSMRPGSIAKPFVYVDFINKWRSAEVPFRVIASRPDGKLWFNIPMTVDNFSYELNKAGHIEYTLDLKEYVFYRELI